MVLFKLRDSVPSTRYSSVCNVLRLLRISLILPTYRVYQFYDIRGGAGPGNTLASSLFIYSWQLFQCELLSHQHQQVEEVDLMARVSFLKFPLCTDRTSYLLRYEAQSQLLRDAVAELSRSLANAIVD